MTFECCTHLGSESCKRLHGFEANKYSVPYQIGPFKRLNSRRKLNHKVQIKKTLRAACLIRADDISKKHPVKWDVGIICIDRQCRLEANLCNFDTNHQQHPKSNQGCYRKQVCQVVPVKSRRPINSDIYQFH